MTAEPLYVEEILEQYSDRARHSGSKILLACGLSGLVVDLGVLHVEKNCGSVTV